MSVAMQPRETSENNAKTLPLPRLGFFFKNPLRINLSEDAESCWGIKIATLYVFTEWKNDLSKWGYEEKILGRPAPLKLRISEAIL